MALDTRRYQNRAAELAPVSLSANALPGLIVLAVGIFIIIAGIILLAAFGVPKDIENEPEDLSGAIVIGLGFLVCLIGVLYAMYLKKKAKRVLEEKRNQQQAQPSQPQRRQPAAHVRRGGATATRPAAVTTSGRKPQAHNYPQAGVYDNQGYYNQGRYGHQVQHPPQYSSYDEYYASGHNSTNLVTTTSTGGYYEGGEVYPADTSTEAYNYHSGQQHNYEDYPYSSRVDT